MRLKVLHIICTLITLVNAASLFAQIDPCLTLLKDARQFSDNGLYDQAIAKANESIALCELSRDDRIDAYKLLFINYLAIDNLEMANETVARILKINPNYEPDKQLDSPEIIAIFQKYKPLVSLAAFIQGGLNYGLVDVQKTYSVVTSNDADGLDNYKALPGLQLGAGLEYRVWKNAWIRLGGFYRQSRYSIALDDIQNQVVTYDEKINFLDINPGIRYYFRSRELQPFVGLGGQFSFLISSLGNITRGEEFDLVDRTEQRNTFFAGYGAEVGLSYKKRSFLFQLSTRYDRFNGNIVNPEYRFNNLDVVFKYYYLDNDFSLSNFQVNLAIAFAIRYKNSLSTQSAK